MNVAFAVLAACVFLNQTGEEIPGKYKVILDAESKQQVARDAERLDLERTLARDEALLTRMEKGQIRLTLTKPFYIPKDDSKPCLFQSIKIRDHYVGLGKASVQKHKDRIAELKKEWRFQFNYLDPRRLELGQIGHVAFPKVFQVIDKSNMLVDLPDDLKRSVLGTVLMSAPTKGLADGSTISNLGPIEIVGTYKYLTVNGSERTVFRANLFDLKALERYRQIAKEKRERRE